MYYQLIKTFFFFLNKRADEATMLRLDSRVALNTSESLLKKNFFKNCSIFTKEHFTVRWVKFTAILQRWYEGPYLENVVSRVTRISKQHCNFMGKMKRNHFKYNYPVRWMQSWLVGASLQRKCSVGRIERRSGRRLTPRAVLHPPLLYRDVWSQSMAGFAEITCDVGLNSQIVVYHASLRGERHLIICSRN